jgi:hypothetical protein
MSRTLLLWLVPLMLCLVSHQAHSEPEATWTVTRSKSIKSNDINCRKKDSEGKAATFCQEVGPDSSCAMHLAACPCSPALTAPWQQTLTFTA